MATQANLRTRIRGNLYGQSPVEDVFASTLGAAIADTSTTSVTVTDGTFWSVSDILEVDETGEQLYVTAVATNTLTVIRGFNDTTKAAATDGGIVWKNPRFSIAQIDRGIAVALDAFELWGVHAFNQGTITISALKQYYELSDTDISPTYGVLSVFYPETNTQIPIPLPFRNAYFHLGTGPSVYSEGQGIHLLSSGDLAAGDPAYYVYAQKLSDVANLSDLQSDILVLGATAIILGKAIIPFTQDPGARTNRSIQGGQVVRDGRFYQSEYFLRVTAEAARVAVERQRFPTTVRLGRAARWRP